MKYKLIFADSFNSDLEESLEYIANTLDNERAAFNLLKIVKEKIAALQDFPEMYRFCDDERLRQKEIRKMLVKNYLVLYTVDYKNKAINVLRFVYAKRDYAKFV